MTRFFFKNRETLPKWNRHIVVHLVALAVCLAILVITVFVKFKEGGWVTILITMLVIGLCMLIRRHYVRVRAALKDLDQMLMEIPPAGPFNNDPVNPENLTAVQLVGGYNGFGVHTFLSIARNFPNIYKNFIFVSVAVVDSGSFKGSREIENLTESVRDSLVKYVDLARRLGFAADYRIDVGTDVVEKATELCLAISKEFPHSTFFTGQLAFSQEKLFYRILHNETSFAIQRRLHWNGISTVILPIRMSLK